MGGVFALPAVCRPRSLGLLHRCLSPRAAPGSRRRRSRAPGPAQPPLLPHPLSPAPSSCSPRQPTAFISLSPHTHQHQQQRSLVHALVCSGSGGRACDWASEQHADAPRPRERASRCQCSSTQASSESGMSATISRTMRARTSALTCSSAASRCSGLSLCIQIDGAGVTVIPIWIVMKNSDTYSFECVFVDSAMTKKSTSSFKVSSRSFKTCQETCL